MRNFLKIAEGVDVTPLLHAITHKTHLWNENDLRTTHPQSPHKEVDDIWLRFNEVPKDPTQVIDDKETIVYPAWYALPQAHSIVFDLLRRVEGSRLGRILITRLKPGGMIPAHIDQGAPAEYYERYHVTLQNNPGSIFKCGNEAVCMRPSEVWWFNNQLEHAVINNSIDDRITMIVDIRCDK